MAERAYIDKSVLKKLREQKKVSFGYIEKTTGFLQAIIEKWENDTLTDEKSFPTIVQAKKLARCYRVPFAAFFMSEANLPTGTLPNMVNKRTQFLGTSTDESSINLAVFDLIAKRDLLLETNEELGIGTETYTPPIIAGNATEWAIFIRAFFEIYLSEQYKLKSPRQFYLYIREKVERKGIFVSCFNGVSVDDCRGLAVYNDTLPIIGLNSDDRPPAKSFSIFHEIVHIFKKSSSFCNTLFVNDSIDDEEVFCNAVAGEVLVPTDALQAIIREPRFKTLDSGTIKIIADSFCVSREVITRRLFNLGEINKNEFDTLNALFAVELRQDKQKLKEQSAGRIPKNVPRETFDKNSNVLCTALMLAYGEGVFSKYDVASFLAVKPKHIDKFFGEVYTWNH
jgi:Zn-dependent peptidase ImmA (M78 family)